MKYDKPLLAYLIGMVLIIPLEIYTRIFKYFNLTHFSVMEYTSMIMVREPNWWIGMMSGPGVGGLAGITIYYSTKVLGADYLPIKGAIIGSITYGLIDVLMGVLTNNPNLSHADTGHFVHASAGILGGALAGTFIKKYLLQPKGRTYAKKVRRYLVIPEPSLKKEPTKKVRFVKPKKL